MIGDSTIKAQLDSYKLNFIDKTENKYFYQIKNEQDKPLINQLVAFSLFWQAIAVFVQKFVYNQDNYIIISANIVIMSPFLFHYRNNQSIFTTILFLQSSIYEIVSSITLHNIFSQIKTSKSYDNQLVCFGFGLCIYVQIINLLFSHWYLKTLKYSVPLISLPFAEGFQSYSVSIFVTHIILLVIVGLIFYRFEINRKQQFHQEYFKKNKLFEYKQLVEKYIPNELILISKEKLVNSFSKKNKIMHHFQSNLTQNKNLPVSTQFPSQNQYLNNIASEQHKAQSSNFNKMKNEKQVNVSTNVQIEKNIGDVVPEEQNLKFSLINDKFIKTFSENKAEVLKRLAQIFKNKINIYQILIQLLSSDEKHIFEENLKVFNKINNIQNNEIFFKKTTNNEQIYEFLECYDIENQKYFDVSIICLQWDGLQSVILLFNDISNTIIKKRLEEVQKHKDLTLASITHDLRTPLNFIKMSSEQCSQETSIEAIYELQQLIQVNCELLMSLINDILDNQQILAGKLRLVASQFNLHSLFQQLIELFKAQCNQQKITMKLQIEQKSFVINSDKNRIKQILINLISNAIKFTQSGQIKIIVQNINNSKCIAISVQDTGCGIPLYLQNKLFSVFSTFDHNNGTNKQGIGLGLSLCKQLVSQLGPLNQIFLQSQIGKGSTFTFILYADIEDAQNKESILQNQELQNNITKFQQAIFDNQFFETEEQIDPQHCDSVEFLVKKYQKQFYKIGGSAEQSIIEDSNSMKNSAKNHPFSNKSQQINKDKFNFVFKKILIVDDVCFNILALKYFFKEYQVHIDSAKNGQEAFQKYQNLKYDLILMDYQMPIMNGYESTSLIRQYEKLSGLSPTIIIINSANSNLDDIQSSLNCGANEHIAKPVDSYILQQILQKYISL